MNLQVKKEIWPVLIQVEPTRETFIKKIKTHERDIEPFQAEAKELDIDHGGHEEEEEDEDDNNVRNRNNRLIQLFPVAGDGDVAGWLDLTATFGEATEQRHGGGRCDSSWILCIGIWFLCYCAFHRLFEDCWSVKRHMYV